MRSFVAYVVWDPKTTFHVGTVPGIPGAHTECATLPELNMNLRKVVQLCLQEYDGSVDALPQLVGVQQVEVEVPAPTQDPA